MLSKRLLSSHILDATPDSQDCLEVKLLKDEVNTLREQLTYASDLRK